MQWSQIPWHPSLRTLRQFAMLGLAVSAVLATVQWRHERTVVAVALLAVGFVLGLVGWLRPGVLRLLLVGWIVLVFPLGWLVLHACLAVVYFGVVTPLALVFRLRGRDPLGLRTDSKASSYWEPKAELPVERAYRTY